MLSQKAKDLFAKIDLDFCPVAVKFSFNKPLGYEESDIMKPLCAFVREAQSSGKSFFIDIAKKPCMGKCVLGATDFEGLAQSGIIGFEHGFFRTPACNARLYHNNPTLKRGSCNYVTFAPVADCNFDPDLIIFVADTDAAALILRASSWVTGDVWESRTTIALNCAWTFAWPYINGKINFAITGVSFGGAHQKLYPKGLHMITIPYQKIDELIAGLDEMEWELVQLRTDEESIAIAKAGDVKIAAMAADSEAAFDLNERCRTTSWPVE